MSYNFKQHLRDTLRNDLNIIINEQGIPSGVRPKLGTLGKMPGGPMASQVGPTALSTPNLPPAGGWEYPNCSFCDSDGWGPHPDHQTIPPVVFQGPGGAVGFFFAGPPAYSIQFTGSAVPGDIGVEVIEHADGTTSYIIVCDYGDNSGYFDSNGVYHLADWTNGESSVPDHWNIPDDMQEGGSFFIIPGSGQVGYYDQDGVVQVYQIPLPPAGVIPGVGEGFFGWFMNWWNGLSDFDRALILIAGAGLIAWAVSKDVQQAVQDIIDKIRGKELEEHEDDTGDGDGGGGPIDGGGPFDIPFPGEDEEEVIEPLPDEEDVVDDDEEEDEDEDPIIG